MLLIALLVFCLVRMKKKNDLIVAKVEKLEAGAIHDLSDNEDKNDDFYNSIKRKASIQQEEASNLPN